MYMCVCMCVCVCVCLSVCLSVCVSVCVSVAILAQGQGASSPHALGLLACPVIAYRLCAPSCLCRFTSLCSSILALSVRARLCVASVCARVLHLRICTRAGVCGWCACLLEWCAHVAFHINIYRFVPVAHPLTYQLTIILPVLVEVCGSGGVAEWYRGTRHFGRKPLARQILEEPTLWVPLSGRWCNRGYVGSAFSS